jgi:hypothetical protein
MVIVLSGRTAVGTLSLPPARGDDLFQLTTRVYVRLTQDEIIVNPIAGLGETRHRYNQVRALEVVLQRRAPDGHLIDQPYPEIEFQDGSRFNPYDVLWDEEPSRDMKLLHLIAQQSRKTIRTVRSLDDRAN